MINYLFLGGLISNLYVPLVALFINFDKNFDKNARFCPQKEWPQPVSNAKPSAPQSSAPTARPNARLERDEK